MGSMAHHIWQHHGSVMGMGNLCFFIKVLCAWGSANPRNVALHAQDFFMCGEPVLFCRLLSYFGQPVIGYISTPISVYAPRQSNAWCFEIFEAPQLGYVAVSKNHFVILLYIYIYQPKGPHWPVKITCPDHDYMVFYVSPARVTNVADVAPQPRKTYMHLAMM